VTDFTKMTQEELKIEQQLQLEESIHNMRIFLSNCRDLDSWESYVLPFFSNTLIRMEQAMINDPRVEFRATDIVTIMLQSCFNEMTAIKQIIQGLLNEDNNELH